MINYRPGNDDEYWADNWFSNSFAWISTRYFRRWCQTPSHWTSRLTLYLWTDCPCCLFWRGAILGIALGAGIMYIIVKLLGL